MPRRCIRHRGLVALAALLALALIAGPTFAPHPARGDEGSLRRSIDRAKTREQSLAGAAAHLARLENAMTRELAIVERRLSAAQTQLNAAQARLAATQQRLAAERARLQRLRRRLGQARGQLDAMLRARYMGTKPDLVGVVLDSHGFADLLERLDFLQRVEHSDTSIVDIVRSARAGAAHETTVLTTLQRRQAATADEVRRERDGLASMQAAAAQRRAALAEARAARLAALRATRADRRSAQRTLDRLLAQRARAARNTAGPGGPWAIPWAIVQCESGGQNLPPNYASASGYYQMLDSTWKGLGGSTPHAYQAPKSEQDRLAAQLWAGGAGASNWVCAALVA